MSNDIIKHIGTYNFVGFYESIFDSADDFYYEEKEIEKKLSEKIDGIDSVDYEYEDYNQYKLDVGELFIEYYFDKINDILPYRITDKDSFKFEYIDDSMYMFSPKEYNYYTDEIYFDVCTNYNTLKDIKDYALKLKGVKEYIHNRFKSCDGRVSFISNDFSYWKSLDIQDYKENMLIGLLDMLIVLSDEKFGGFEDIYGNIFDNISKYEYAFPFVYYKGKKFELYDFMKKQGVEIEL